MHIKEAFEKQLTKNTIHRSKGSMERSQIIGSKHMGKISFQKDTEFFKDFKPRKNIFEAKQQTLELKKSNYLEQKPFKWNQSVQPLQNLQKYTQKESHRQKLLKIKLGFYDKAPLSISPYSKKIYQGVDSRNNFSGWNISNVVEQKQLNSGVLSTNINAIDHSINFNKSNIKHHKKLTERYKQNLDFQKSRLFDNSDILEDIKKNYCYDNPKASLTKSNAASLRIFQEQCLQKVKKKYQPEEIVYDNNFKASLSKMQKNNIKVKYYHSGQWESRKFGKNKNDENEDCCESDKGEEEECIWSCCLKSEKNSKGCCLYKIDKNKMNFCSFTN